MIMQATGDTVSNVEGWELNLHKPLLCTTGIEPRATAWQVHMLPPCYCSLLFKNEFVCFVNVELCDAVFWRCSWLCLFLPGQLLTTAVACHSYPGDEDSPHNVRSAQHLLQQVSFSSWHYCNLWWHSRLWAAGGHFGTRVRCTMLLRLHSIILDQSAWLAPLLTAWQPVARQEWNWQGTALLVTGERGHLSGKSKGVVDFMKALQWWLDGNMMCWHGVMPENKSPRPVMTMPQAGLGYGWNVVWCWPSPDF